MKRKLLILLTVFSMCGLIACGGEKTDDANAGGNNGEPVVTEAPADEVEVTPEPTAEPKSEVEPTAEPVEEATPAPTEEPSVVYEGIDMESTLPGQEWLETFICVIDEPKVVVFSDITGKKVIVEQEGEVTINPDEDAMALFFPEGYTNGNVTNGIARNADKKMISTGNYEIFYLDSKEMRAVGESKAAFLVMKGDERVVLIVSLKIE